MFGKLTAKYIVVTTGFVCLLIANPKLLAAQITPQKPTDWYCDERWQDNNFIYVGTVAEIVLFEAARAANEFPEKSFLVNGVEYEIKNTVRFSVEKIYRGASDGERREIVIYNTQTASASAFDFKVGEKYLVYPKSHGYGEGGGKGMFSDYLNYTAPGGKTKSVAEAGETIAFLEKVYRLDSTKEILDYEGEDFISGGVIGGKATALVKPAYPEDARKENASGAVKVMVLVDEQGQIIKAKAVCAKHPALARAAEAAALLSKFSPTMINGKPVKVKGTIVYNFVR